MIDAEEQEQIEAEAQKRTYEERLSLRSEVLKQNL